MNDWLLFIFLVLVNYRLSQLLVYDDGPGDIIFRLRDWIGVYDVNEAGERQTFFAKLLACPYCVGLWLALPLALVGTLHIYSVPIWWLAIAGGQSFLESRGYASSR